ncbi:hypothetical protein HPB51_028943 [Rhipicephalus microplus]|uniref:Uncharacterized protein n=1 Tax=Rhipicephalus microplus TaxID=6941 RepID=A0A9J6CVZ0_RHIMP|nr:hypothetical protein HPB51_028943 [Rhipicephalus microplus]
MLATVLRILVVAAVGVACLPIPSRAMTEVISKAKASVSAVSDDLKPAATGLIGAGGYGGYGGLGQGVNNFQSGYGTGGFGKGYGGFSNYGNNKALAGGGFGKGSYGDNVVSAYGNQGLGQGGINNLATHGLHGVSGATGFNHQGGVNKQFAGKGAARDQFNAGHNKASETLLEIRLSNWQLSAIFAKEKVYAVDQSFQNGNRDAFNLGYGNLGGFTGQGGFGKQEKVNQYGNQQYGAFKGYGQGNYGKHGRTSFGEGAHWHQQLRTRGRIRDASAAGQGIRRLRTWRRGQLRRSTQPRIRRIRIHTSRGTDPRQARSSRCSSGCGIRSRARNRTRNRGISWADSRSCTQPTP